MVSPTHGDDWRWYEALQSSFEVQRVHHHVQCACKRECNSGVFQARVSQIATSIKWVDRGTMHTEMVLKATEKMTP